MDGVLAIVRGAWDMGLYDFCRLTDLDSADQEAHDAFRHFQAAADHLRQLDVNVLGRLVQYRAGMANK